MRYSVKKRKESSSYFLRNFLLTHLKPVPTKKYFLAVTEILARTNDARKTPTNPFEVFVQIRIIGFTLNWMMKSKQVKRNARRIVSQKQYHAWPSHQANVYLSCKLLINAYAETIKSLAFHWKISHYRLKRETNISLVSTQAWSAAPSPQSMFCICSWASFLLGWNKQLSTAITDQFVWVKSPVWVNKQWLVLDEEWQAVWAWTQAGERWACLSLLKWIPSVTSIINLCTSYSLYLPKNDTF